MSTQAHECLMRMYHEEHDLESYQGSIPRWCSGCGDNAILTAVQRLCRDEKLRPEKTVFVSGIGCSSRLPHYMKTYGFHGIHGRALPIAEGIRLARPDLNVFVNDRRRGLLQHRCGPLGARHPLQHESDRDAARQPDLRPHQDAGLPHVAERPAAARPRRAAPFSSR